VAWRMRHTLCVAAPQVCTPCPVVCVSVCDLLAKKANKGRSINILQVHKLVGSGVYAA